MPSVFLLKPGSIVRDEDGRILDARSSVTLILSGGHKIVVDSGLAGEEDKILTALEDIGVKPEEIDSIINTHSHPDHCGNDHLFPRARVLGARDGDHIAPGVWVMATPGHSRDSISVVVETKSMGAGRETLVVAGDALPTFGNFQKMVPPALHVDRNQAVASMEKITALADIVIPGHDLPFSVQKVAYVSLPMLIRNQKS
jgi:glyoxylase-like metal-dependent hydrolase (beta-lactamase superfamily II)